MAKKTRKANAYNLRMGSTLSKSAKITLYNSQRDFSFSIPQVKKVVLFLLKELNITTDEIIIHFVSELRIRALHEQFFNDPSVTDCITFPLDSHQDKNPFFHILGEIFICPKTANA